MSASKRLMKRVVFLLAASVLMSDTTAAEAPPPDRIPAGVKRVEPDRLAHYWLLDPASAQNANVPNSGYGLDAPTCAAVSYVVERNGATSHVKLERVVPDGRLGKVAVDIVKVLRYGAAAENPGGTANLGCVWEVVKGSGAVTTLASFTSTTGSHPDTNLVFDSAGNLYGTTWQGGANDDGTVFELVKGSNTITTLASFNFATTSFTPEGRLLIDSSGNLFGTAKHTANQYLDRSHIVSP